MTDRKDGPNVYTERLKLLTMRIRDPFGYLLFEVTCLIPESMVSNVMTDWTNTFNLKARFNDDVPYYLDVVLK